MGSVVGFTLAARGGFLKPTVARRPSNSLPLFLASQMMFQCVRVVLAAKLSSACHTNPLRRI